MNHKGESFRNKIKFSYIIAKVLSNIRQIWFLKILRHSGWCIILPTFLSPDTKGFLKCLDEHLMLHFQELRAGRMPTDSSIRTKLDYNVFVVN
jgi:hypothetical protein